MSTSSRNLAFKIALVLGSTLACLLVLEALAALFQGPRIYPLVYYQTADPRVQLWCYDDHFNSIADADLRQKHAYGRLTYLDNADEDTSLADLPPERVPHAVRMARNEVDLRERPYALLKERTRSEPVYLLVGDSFGFGQGVRVEDRFSDLLEARLDTGLIVNACIPGANIGTIGRLARHYLEDLAPVRRVIYAFTLNDAVRSAAARRRERTVYDFMHFRQNLAQLPLDSHLLRWAAVRVWRRRLADQTVDWYLSLYSDTQSWSLTRKALLDLHQACQAQRAALSLVVFPLFYRFEDYPFQAAHDKLAQLAHQHSIHLIDLLPLFAGANAEDYWVHPTDFHPNHRAHQLTADHLYGAVPW